MMININDVWCEMNMNIWWMNDDGSMMIWWYWMNKWMMMNDMNEWCDE